MLAGVVGAVAAVLTIPAINRLGSSSEDDLGQGVDGPPPISKLADLEPSFDCDEALTWTEKTICGGDEQLVSLDLKLNALFYRDLLKQPPEQRDRLLLDQKKWLATTNQCREFGDGVYCLVRLYSKRISFLNDQAEQ